MPNRETKPGAAGPTTASAGQVLLVEDDPFAADVVEDMLAEIGYGNVVRAATVDEALDRLRQMEPLLVVLDANLRGEPAHAVAEALRQRSIPFVVSTGFDPTKLPPAFQHGIALRKPYGFQKLGVAIKEVLAQRKH